MQAAESPLRGYRLTIVAMGTSAPEAAVSITAGLAGSNELALSNVIGSNLFNLVLIVGICALIRPFIVDQSIMKRDFPVAILSSILLLFFIRDNFLSRIEGVILLILMAAYLIATVTSAIRNPIDMDEAAKYLPMHTSLLYILLGLAGIIVGGNLVVDNACRVAAAFGLSETLIGLTIVAIGTSLPELVTSITASRKGESVWPSEMSLVPTYSILCLSSACLPRFIRLPPMGLPLRIF